MVYMYRISFLGIYSQGVDLEKDIHTPKLIS